MKNIILLTACLFGFICFINGQKPDPLSQKLAKRLQDSLSLSEEQGFQLQTINTQLSVSKQVVWQQFHSADSIQVHLQKIENTRNQLYREVLTKEQFLLYLQRKHFLLNNN